MVLNVKLVAALKRTVNNYDYEHEHTRNQYVTKLENNGTCNSISKYGDKIYVSYNIHVNDKNKMICELFENKGNKLFTISSLHGDIYIYKYLHGGYASNDFNMFSIIDSDGKDRVRIRILDNCLRELNSRVFTDYYGPSNEVMGGNMSSDNKYVVLSYVIDNNVGKGYQKSIIRILDTNSLIEKKSYILYGNVSSQPRFFKLINDENEYIILTTHNIKNSITFKNIDPPRLRILKMNDSFLDQICEIELIEKSDYDFVRTPKNSLCIVIGTLACHDDNGPNYIDNLNKSYICGNNSEYRIYKYKKQKLKLISDKKYGFDIYPKFYPTDFKIAINQTINSSSTFQIFDIDQEYLPMDDTGCRSVMLPQNSRYNFSSDGSWLIVTGSMVDSKEINKKYEKNILLFHLC